MLILDSPAAEARRKQLDALQRAVPVTRMVDYGAPLGEALALHARVQSEDPPQWDEACESLAERQAGIARRAEQAGRRITAAQAWRATSALLQCAHLAFNEDVPRKKALYQQAQDALQRHGALRGDLAPFCRPTPFGDLHGWLVRPSSAPVGAVLVLGGLSGWGGSYLDMGRALAERGLLAILGEGPGQGWTRLAGGLSLRIDNLPLLGEFLNLAQSEGVRRFGVWGNSFGGLFAAHLAASDPRVGAVCINGAPMVPTVPSFRTAREQMAAVFGTQDEQLLADRVGALAMAPGRHRVPGAMLVVQGGRDPLVPLGEQASFLTLADGPTATMTWDDGEHTIYNHAGERNALVADWFGEQLGERR